MNGLDLFSGIGGISIALEPWVRTIAYCEQNKYAQGVLLSRMQSSDIDRAPIFDDVRKLSCEQFITKPDIIFGGFPCQDISVAGNGAGLAGKRSGLFYEIIRLTKEINPSFVFLENVPAIRTRGLREVIRAFTEIGYDCRWTCLSAASTGAPHKRERWFLLANANGVDLGNQWEAEMSSHGQLDQWPAKSRNDGQPKSLANSAGKVRNYVSSENEPSQKWYAKSGLFAGSSWWEIEPNVGRVVNGLPFRVDRLKCLGNSVVPAQVREAFIKLSGLQIAKKRIGG